MGKKNSKKKAPVVAVLNLKGGVGKTTVSAHVFRVFFERLRASTLLVDLDPQFNLTQTILTRSAYETFKKQEKTIMSVMEPPPAVSLFQVKTSPAPPPKPDSVATRLWHFKTSESLDLLPGDFRL